jgi:hypothetical protein
LFAFCCHCLCCRRSSATLVAIALAAVAIALFVARHPRRQRHGPCRPCPLCQLAPSLPSPSPLPSLPSSLLPSPSAARPRCLSSPTVVVVWSPRQCPLASHYLSLLLLSLVDCHDYPMLPNTRDPSAGGARGTHRRAPQISVYGEPTSEPTRGNLMVGEAGTRMSYHSSGGALIASCHPSLRCLTMVGCCVLCKAEAAAPPPAANQWQHQLENVYVSRILGLILTYLQYFWIYFSEYILRDLHTPKCNVLHFWEVVVLITICQGIPDHHPPFFDLSSFFSLCLPPFMVPLSIFFASNICLPESLFLDKN